MDTWRVLYSCVASHVASNLWPGKKGKHYGIWSITKSIHITRSLIMRCPNWPSIIWIKRVLLAVAQSWSRLIEHEASFCGGCYCMGQIQTVCQVTVYPIRGKSHCYHCFKLSLYVLVHLDSLQSRHIIKGSNRKTKMTMMTMMKNNVQTKRSHAGS